MATKPAAKSAAKKPGTALTVWEQRMQQAAEKQAKQEKPMGGFQSISTQGGVLSVDGNEVGDTMNLVVLCAAYENAFYGGEAFDPDNPKPPVCYAFGDLESDDPEDTMAPAADLPGRVADKCSECENNVMGSAPQGRGKACKNIRRLAVVTEDAIKDADTMSEAEIRMLKVPVTSVRNWSTYVRGVLTDELSRPYWSVVTELTIRRDKKTQFKLNFAHAENVDFNDKLWKAFEDQQKKVKALITAPYPVPEDGEEEAPKKAVKKTAKYGARR